ncbi:MAG: membrane protein insertion efficiency factor YidD [Chryseobacterium sp.]
MNSFEIPKKLPFSFLILSVFLCMFFSTIHADPWGKDESLVKQKTINLKSTKSCNTLLFGQFGEALICFHQRIISPADGPRSHFIPSSSQYTLDAIRKYGFFTGVSMGCDRLMRENNDPWVYRLTYNTQGKVMKYDPVP